MRNLRTTASKQDGVRCQSKPAAVCLWLFTSYLTLMGSIAFSAQTISAEQSTSLTSLSQVASLTREDGGKNLAVKVRGTVTFCDRDQGLLFLQEGTDAITVRIPITRENDEVDPQPGQFVEVEGVVMAGRIKCSIRSKGVRLIGQGQMPAALELNGRTPFTEQAESRWASVRGWISGISTAGNRWNFGLVVKPGQSVDVILNGGDTPGGKDLTGAFAEAIGVFTLKFNSAGRITGGRLYVGNLAGIQATRTLAIAPIVDVGSSSAKKGVAEPFRVRGTVVSHSLGEFLILRDTSGSLRIPYLGLNYFNPGSLVEVFAYPLQQRPDLVLTNVTVKLVPPDSSNEEPVSAIIRPGAANTNLSTLTNVTQIRKLSPQQASRGYPVLITGVITYHDNSYLHFVQDETSGIYFDLSKFDNPPSLHSGQRVQIQGFSGPGDYAPIIISQTIRAIGEDAFPSPESVTFAKLMGGNFDSQWVSLKGVVRNEWITTNSSTLALFAGDGLVKVILPGPAPQSGSPTLIDASIEVQGVCCTLFDDRRRLQGVEIQVPDWKQLAVKEVPTDDPFKLPVKPVNDLFQFHADAGESHRVRLMGVVTLRRADGSLYLQDGSGGIQIQPASTTPGLRIDAMVDVAGFPVIVDKRAMLQEAIVHCLRRASTPIEPAELKPDTALEETLQATLVRLEGQILSHFSHGSEDVLNVRFGQKAVDVVLEKQFGGEGLAELEPGTVVRLTGVYVRQPDNAAGAQIFRVLLRTPEDLWIISRPSWWTMERTLWALVGLAGVLLLVLGWVRALRLQVRQRTKELHEEIEHHKRTESMLEAEITERKRMETEVERSHQELLIASRQAGMAEVATSVLHNVGNVLNSVNVSAGLVGEKIRNSKVSNIARAAEMIKAHAGGDLANYLEHDPKGRQLPQYLSRLAQHLNNEQTGILSELDSLRKNVEHIKGIVGMQQSYAKVFGAAEPVKPTELLEDALRLNSGALLRHEVRVVREYEPNLPEITVDKHKLLQILVNLICNAKKACDESIHPEKLLTVKIVNGEGRLKISVIDNGVGIPKENLTRIFNHGFTTRKDGHGFGLHSGSLAAKEMGGALVAHSDGPGKGAVFIVELPVTGK